MSKRNVSILIEEGASGRVLGKSDSISTQSQLAVSPARNGVVPATVRFSDIDNFNVFAKIDTSESESVYGLVDRNSRTISVSFTDMAVVKVLNILTDRELEKICEQNPIEKVFSEKRLHERFNDQITQLDD